MKQVYKVYRIGFNGNDETEFDVKPGTEQSEMLEAMKLFEVFLLENNMKFAEINYIECVGTYEGDDY